MVDVSRVFFSSSLSLSHLVGSDLSAFHGGDSLDDGRGVGDTHANTNDDHFGFCVSVHITESVHVCFPLSWEGEMDKGRFVLFLFSITLIRFPRVCVN